MPICVLKVTCAHFEVRNKGKKRYESATSLGMESSEEHTAEDQTRVKNEEKREGLTPFDW
jgi:hypothetical protein